MRSNSVKDKERNRKSFFVFYETYRIKPFFSDCCPSVDPELELAVGAGNADALTTWPTPNHDPTSTATSTQIVTQPHQTCTTARRPSRASGAAATELTTLPSSDPPKYCDVAAETVIVNYRCEHRDVPLTFGGAIATGNIP